MPKYQLTEKQKELLCSLVPGFETGQVTTEWLIIYGGDGISGIFGLDDDGALWREVWDGVTWADFDDFAEHRFFRLAKRDKHGYGTHYTLNKQRIIDACKSDFELPNQDDPTARNTFTIHNTSGIVNVQSTFENVQQTINNAPALSEAFKQQLENLLNQLHAELESVPDEGKDDAEAVVVTASRLAEDVGREKPNKTSIGLSLESLIKAAENVAKFVPAIITTAQAIVTLIRNWLPS